jgi:aminoglycoside phosphotransferase (APT) family kinase protein
MVDGGSTYVFRLRTEHETFYLRVLPEEGATFLPEAEAHRRLRGIGVKVPEVIYCEAHNALLGRSIMVTTEIPGIPISSSPFLSQTAIEAIAIEAGADLARINSVDVAGFGWIDREVRTANALRAPLATYDAFVRECWEDDLRYLESTVLSLRERNELERVVAQHSSWLVSETAQLAHGDFDPTHIFQLGGRYTGIIDFGEIRGTDQWYDLGQFHFRDREQLSQALEPYLTRGYDEVVSLPPDYPEHIRVASLLINVRSLTHSLDSCFIS